MAMQRFKLIVPESSRIKEIRVCDKCGKPCKSLRPTGHKETGINQPFRIPVRYNNYHDGTGWKNVTIDACDDCLAIVWKFFGCRGTLE